jgi:hypothetical protein
MLLFWIVEFSKRNLGLMREKKKGTSRTSVVFLKKKLN